MLPKSPFKFLDSYSKEDKEIFFGRDNEIEDIYAKVFQSNLLLIYGASGTGKSSLINCGLANKFHDTDWLPINIRRGFNINKSILNKLKKIAITPVENIEGDKDLHLKRLLKSIYLDYFKPIFLIFDQFEELFIFGERDEWLEFIEGIKTIKDSNLQVKIIFVIRGEYLEFLSEFEEVIPDFFNNRIRVEKMTRHNALQCIDGPCKAFNIDLEGDFSENLLLKLSPESAEIELTYLQVFLDRIYKIVIESSKEKELLFTNSILNDLGNIGDVLSEFLDDQIDQIPDSEKVLTLLKAFVTGDGTKKQISTEEARDFSKILGKEIPLSQVESIIQELVNRRILKDKDEADRYELRHDSIADKIYQKITQYERDLIEVKQFLDYAYNEYTKRDFLLNESDLAYVSPYQEKLQLPKKVTDFIEKSSKIIKKKKRSRKQFYTVVGIIVVLLITSVSFLVYSLQQKAIAEDLTEIANQESQEAQRQRSIADVQKSLADENAIKAEQQATLALNQSQIADEQRKLAEDQRILADKSRLEAERQRRLALEEKQNAEKAQLEAEKNSQEAEIQRGLAEEERAKAARLRMISIAQSLGTKSIQIQDITQKSLLALQALKFNQEFDGYDFQADIYSGLYSAHRSLQGDDFNLIDLHQGPVKGIVSFREMALTIGSDGKLVMVDFSGETPTTKVLLENTMVYHSLAISGDGTFLAIGTEEGVIIIYDPINQQMIKNLDNHDAGVWALAFTKDNRALISAGNDRKIIFWDLTTYESYVISETQSIINSLSIHPGMQYLVAGLVSGAILKFPLDENSAAENIPIDAGGNISISKVNFNNHGNLLAIGTETGNIILWDVNKSEVYQSLSGHQAMVTDLEFREDDNFMISSSLDGTIRLWNLEHINERPVVFSDHQNWVLAAGFTHDGKDILTGDANGLLKIYPLDMSAMSKDFCKMLNRNLSIDEWNKFVGADIAYELTCESLSFNK